MNADKLSAFAAALYDGLLLAWLNTPQWASIREATEPNRLVRPLLTKAKQKDENHHSVPAAEVADKTSVTLLQANPAPSKSVHKLNAAISEKGPYELVSVADLAPSDRPEKYLYVQE